MRTFFSALTAAAAATIVLAGCSSAGQTPTVPSQSALGGAPPGAPVLPRLKNQPPPAGYKGLPALYVYDLATSTVDILKNKTYRDIGTIPEGPSFTPAGSFLDKWGDYYLASTSEVLEYAPGSQAPLFTYFPPANDTIEGITVDSHGDVYVATDNSDSTTSIIEYFQGSDKAVYFCSAAGGPAISYRGLAVDTKNDVFAEYNDLSGSSPTVALWEYAGGLNSQGSRGGGCAASQIVAPMSGTANNLALDASGNLIVPIYPAGGSTGGFIAVISNEGSSYVLTREITAGLSAPFSVSLNKSNKYLFAANIENSGSDVVVFDYGTGSVVRTLSAGNGLNFPIFVSDGPNAVY